MLTRLGEYKTKSGHRAIVAQLRSVQGRHWILRGAVEDEGVLYIFTWDSDGKVQAGMDSPLDLLGEDVG